MLDDIRIASPCTVGWDGMTGSDRVRNCGLCKLNVYNISEMSRDEATALIRESEGRLCVRLFRRQDGTVVTRDCTARFQAIRRKIMTLACGLLTIIGFVLGAASLGRRNENALRKIEPIKSVMDWVDPEPSVIEVGKICPSKRPAANGR